MDIQKEREAFENWAIKASGGWASFSKSHGEIYANNKLQFAWEAWQTAKANTSNQPDQMTISFDRFQELMSKAVNAVSKTEVAVPEGFVSINDGLPKEGQQVIAFDTIKNCVFESGEFLQEYYEPDTGHAFSEPVEVTHWKAIEAQKSTTTQLIINWGMECPKCNHNKATCYSTATKESGYMFMDGDAVVCLKCGNKGEMDADGENSDIAWGESWEPESD